MLWLRQGAFKWVPCRRAATRGTQATPLRGTLSNLGLWGTAWQWDLGYTLVRGEEWAMGQEEELCMVLVGPVQRHTGSP